MSTTSLSIAVLLLWEGATLQTPNIVALQNFRQNYPHIPITHVVSPAYFLRSSEESQEAQAYLDATKRYQDSYGIHIAPWKSITKIAGVPFRDQPTFWGNQINWQGSDEDVGKEVPLTAYRAEEMESIIQTSLDVWKSHRSEKPRVSHVAGFLATPEILGMLASKGIELDVSSTVPSTMEQSLFFYPLFQWLKTLGTEDGILSTLQQHTHESASLKRLKVSGYIADYLNTQEGIARVDKALMDRQATDPSSYLTILMHQESAAQYLPRVTAVLEQIKRTSKALGLNPTFVSLPGAP